MSLFNLTCANDMTNVRGTLSSVLDDVARFRFNTQFRFWNVVYPIEFSLRADLYTIMSYDYPKDLSTMSGEVGCKRLRSIHFTCSSSDYITNCSINDG